MPRSNQNPLRNSAINNLAADADLAQVAEWLNLRVVGRDTTAPKILCPFHDDRRPSMRLYSENAFGRSQFHCFSCGAHGDVFDLIKRQLNVDFQTALNWLAARYRVTLPSYSSKTPRDRVSNRVRGLELGLSIYQRQNKREASALSTWAIERSFSAEFLKKSEVFVAYPPKISIASQISQREQFDELEAAGLILRSAISRPGQSAPLPLEIPPRDFYNSPRAVFAIRDDRGIITGFAGRAIGDELPKYLFSPGFPRGETLYRLDKVRSARLRRGTKRGTRIVDLFLVEGLMDALRLESIGLQAVALFGSQLATKQIGLLTDLANNLDRESTQLAVHLLLDSDEAGRRGTISATSKLLDALVDTPGMLLDVLIPTTSDTQLKLIGHDPDELFRQVVDSDAALTILSEWCYSPMTALLAAALDVKPETLDAAWSLLPDGERLQAFRDVERRLNHSRWLDLLDRVPLFECHLRKSTHRTSAWEEPLRRFLRAARVTEIPTESTGSAEKDDDGHLIRALQIAEASNQRREFPIDDGSWDRLQASIDVTIPNFRELLRAANEPSRLDADPMLSVRVPKGDGTFRLKAIPSPEILSIQQYVLNELLSGYVNCPRFRQLIPAVRFSASSGVRRLETTGGEHLVPADGETVSFAYTLDMDVVEHRAPPRRTGMFRPYFECWQDFIGFIDTRVAAFPPGKFHVARLDVRSFYDSVSRPVVNAVLLPGVRNALKELADSSESHNPLNCARLFLPQLSEPDERASAIVDWLCDQSFNYTFEEPGSLPTDERPNGLPQGPDLSAYLANISLFPLDRALSEIVRTLDQRASEEQGEVIRAGETSALRGAVYARYVDDMVIIARTGRDLGRLRSAIEYQLALVGMQLNPKTEPLPTMDEADVRKWLTDRRGAGLGVSGPFEGPPGNTPLSLLEPLAETGETDRNDSLRILHDPRLDDPDTLPDELESAIEVALAAPGLRHGDKATAARHLWRCVFRNQSDPIVNVQEVAAAFIKLWTTSVPVPKEKTSTRIFDVPELLACLEGIDRFLSSRQDRNPTFSEEKHEVMRDYRIHMAKHVHAGLCEHLIHQVQAAKNPSRFDHMLELKALAIHRLATLVYRPSQFFPTDKALNGSRAKARLLISLAEAQESTDIIDSAYFRRENASLNILFHESVARLRIANRRELSPTDVDPLLPVGTSMTTWRQRGGVPSDLEAVLHLWMPHGTAVDSNTIKSELALSTFINLISRHAVELLDRRDALKSFALKGNQEGSIRLLPTPPGLNVPGLLGLRNDDKIVLRADFRQEENQTFSPMLEWKAIESERTIALRRSEADLASHRYLPPSDEPVSHPRIARWLAMAFRRLTDGTRLNGPAIHCPPTASNLLGPELGTETIESDWELLGFCVPPDKMATQAFLRQGDGGLVLEPVLGPHAHLWQVGTALADWVGRALSTRQISSQRLAAPSLVQKHEDDWALEGMLRFSLCRLRGANLPVSPLRLSETGLPLTVERTLERLEKFPTTLSQSTGDIGLAHLLATLAEGRAINSRINTRIDPALCGGPAAILIEMVRGQFRADEELALRLPAPAKCLPKWAPMRRPPRAFFALSERLAALAAVDPAQSNNKTLDAIVCGTRLLCIESLLRCQSLELWYLLDASSQRRFEEFPPNLANWNLDATALLHRDQPSVMKGASIPEDGRNVRELFHKLLRATTEGQRVDWGTLAGVTPLGWLVVLGTMTDMLAGDWRGGFVDAEKLDTPDRIGFETVASQLSLTGTNNDDPPWGGLERLIDVWNGPAFESTLALLDRLDGATGVLTSTHESSLFYLESSRRRATEVHTSDGRRRLPGWAISTAKAFDESQDGTERVPPLSSNQTRVVFRWTESWRSDRLVGIGVVQPAMVALAGQAFTEENPPTRLETSALFKGALISDSHVVEARTNTDETESSTSPEVVPVSQRSTVEAGNVTGRGDEAQAALSKLKELQDASWKSRSGKPKSHIRVAFFQWNVDETYRHPVFELCERGHPRHDRERPEMWNKYGHGFSCAEYRRQTLLREVLKACKAFDVEVLLLPEYSTRPETVEWLASHIPEMAPKTSVWAGTYRLPPGGISTAQPGWSAVHEVILCGPPLERRERTKKYPAPAANEIIYPRDSTIEPVVKDQKIGDVCSFIYELICSEVFLVTSPANLRPLARIRRDLLRKFHGNLGGKILETEIDNEIMEDIKTFGAETAISDGLGGIRRTIPLVPAMTSRTADYSVLGQAGFLASGLTTVFCNAVCHSYGHGQSCFVGHDGWIDGKEAIGSPTLEPYHGARPGVFHLDHWHRGRLGKHEQAMVIADIDPIYGIESKPRPQMLLKPLNLVAHLPVVETANRGGESRLKCRCHGMLSMSETSKFVLPIFNALRPGINAGWRTTMDDSDPKQLADALGKLAECAGFPHGADPESSFGWLMERKKAYFAHHRADPHPWPPPVSLDWLLADMSDAAVERFPKIEIPSYVGSPNW